MTSSVRVRVTAAPTNEGWRFTLACPDANWSVERDVAAFPEPPRYPVPRMPCTPNCSHQLCSAASSESLQDILDGLARRETTEDGETVGRYLFDTLLGSDWLAVIELAEQLDRDVVELALTWPYQDAGTPGSYRAWVGLSQLPWELMRDDRGSYLATAGDRAGVAVTRVVADTTQQMPGFSVPPRVLFVVGARVTDPEVRAGAEMLALLREVRSAGSRIRHRILDNATPRRLREAMSAFQPDIVHFISHGELRTDSRGQIKLESDAPDQNWWSAEKLLQHLRVGRRLPSVVVLSACDSAGSALAGSQLAAPLAAELVHGGVPVVVAMAGTVSDRACRVFTRYFGRALAAGESLVVATAQARRLAFAETASAGADWALPAVFFSAAVNPETVRHADDPTAKDVEELLNRAHLKKVPVFCARENLLQTFWAMLAEGENPTGWEVMRGKRPAVLTVCAGVGQRGLGKTRMLEELAREALQDGHLPLLVGTGGDNPPPRDIRDLADGLAKAMQWLGRRVLLVRNESGTELNRLVKRDPTEMPGPDTDSSSLDEVTALAEALELDADLLRHVAAAQYPMLFGDSTRVVLLIDNLGEASVPLLTKLFDRRDGLNEYGLALSPDHVVPVVLIVLTDEGPGIRHDLATGVKSEDWLVSRDLKPFDPKGEDLLAYELVLLNPFRSGGNELTRRPWIFNRDPAKREENAGYARDSLEGRPGYFDDIVFDKFVQAGVRFHVLAPADDDIRPQVVR